MTSLSHKWYWTYFKFISTGTTFPFWNTVLLSISLRSSVVGEAISAVFTSAVIHLQVIICRWNICSWPHLLLAHLLLVHLQVHICRWIQIQFALFAVCTFAVWLFFCGNICLLILLLFHICRFLFAVSYLPFPTCLQVDGAHLLFPICCSLFAASYLIFECKLQRKFAWKNHFPLDLATRHSQIQETSQIINELICRTSKNKSKEQNFHLLLRKSHKAFFY